MPVSRYSQLRRQPRINLAEAVPLPMPLGMYVDPCSVCNYRCVFCPQSVDRTGGHFSSRMDMPAFERVAANIADMGRLKTLNLFSFGEPLLNPLTSDFLRLATSMGLAEKYVITSNASLLTKDKARALVDNGLTFLRVSIYGADTEHYRKRTGTHVVLEQIEENLRYIKQYRDSVNGELFIAVKMLNTGDAAENAAFLKRFADLGDECFLEPMHNWHDSAERFAGGSVCNDRQICPYPFYTLVVHADLTVSVCCPDWNKTLAIGSLASESLRDIWQGDKLFALQCSLLEKTYTAHSICRTCSFYKINAGDNIDSLDARTFSARRDAYQQGCGDGNVF